MAVSKMSKKALAKIIATKNFSKPAGPVLMPRGATHFNKKTAYNRQKAKRSEMDF